MNFLPHLLYLKDPILTWFNPCWGYYGFWSQLHQFQKEQGLNFDQVWKHRKMKRNKEIYVTAIAALCMQQDQPAEHDWWFTKPKQDPPDGLIGTPLVDKEENANSMHVREVEVVEHLDGSITETIKLKLGNKAYEPNTILVCLLSPIAKDISIYSFGDIAKQVYQAKMPLAHIFLVGHGSKISTSLNRKSDEELYREINKIMLVQLSPTYGVINISPNECCKHFFQGEKTAWLRFTKIGRSTEFKKITEEAPKLFD